jgi:hypothetical protein
MFSSSRRREARQKAGVYNPDVYEYRFHGGIASARLVQEVARQGSVAERLARRRALQRN